MVTELSQALSAFEDDISRLQYYAVNNPFAFGTDAQDSTLEELRVQLHAVLNDIRDQVERSTRALR